MKGFTILALALCAGCAETRMSGEVLDIARTTTTAGAFHIEFDSDGRLVEAAGEVPLDAVPAACRAAADAAFPGGRQTGAERAYIDDATAWMVAKDMGGRPVEVIVRDDATVYGGEEVLAEAAWPAAVVEAAKAAVPGATLERVERVWGVEPRGGEAYHLK